MNPSGEAICAFEYYDGIGNFIWAVRQTPYGAWSYPPDQISFSQTDQDIRLAINANGDAVAIWNDLNGANAEVYAARFTGEAWQVPQLISAAAGFDSYVGGVAIDASGTATIVWEAPTMLSSSQIQTRTLSNAGVLTPIVPITPNEIAPISTGKSKVAVDPSGYAVAVWRRISSGIFTVQTASRTGGVWSAPFDLSDGLTNSEDPSVAVDGSGNAVAVWRQLDGGFFRVKARTLPFGGAWSALATLSPAGVSSARISLSMNSTR